MKLKPIQGLGPILPKLLRRIYYSLQSYGTKKYTEYGTKAYPRFRSNIITRITCQKCRYRINMP